MERVWEIWLKGTGSRALQLRKMKHSQAMVCKSFRLVPGGGGGPRLSFWGVASKPDSRPLLVILNCSPI